MTMTNQETHLCVVGCRDWRDKALIFDVLDEMRTYLAEAGTPITGIVTGDGGRYHPQTGETFCGADLWAQDWAKARGIPCVTFNADWYATGKMDRSAGPRRNTLIVNKGNRLVAFWDRTSKGTKDSLTKAAARHDFPPIWFDGTGAGHAFTGGRQ